MLRYQHQVERGYPVEVVLVQLWRHRIVIPSRQTVEAEAALHIRQVRHRRTARQVNLDAFHVQVGLRRDRARNCRRGGTTTAAYRRVVHAYERLAPGPVAPAIAGIYPYQHRTRAGGRIARERRQVRTSDVDRTVRLAGVVRNDHTAYRGKPCIRRVNLPVLVRILIHKVVVVRNLLQLRIVRVRLRALTVTVIHIARLEIRRPDRRAQIAAGYVGKQVRAQAVDTDRRRADVVPYREVRRALLRQVAAVVADDYTKFMRTVRKVRPVVHPAVRALVVAVQTVRRHHIAQVDTNRIRTGDDVNRAAALWNQNHPLDRNARSAARSRGLRLDFACRA